MKLIASNIKFDSNINMPLCLFCNLALENNGVDYKCSNCDEYFEITNGIVIHTPKLTGIKVTLKINENILNSLDNEGINNEE